MSYIVRFDNCYEELPKYVYKGIKDGNFVTLFEDNKQLSKEKCETMLCEEVERLGCVATKISDIKKIIPTYASWLVKNPCYIQIKKDLVPCEKCKYKSECSKNDMDVADNEGYECFTGGLK